MSLNPIASGDAAWRVAVVGGGISGLAAAHRLTELSSAASRPIEVTLFEAGTRFGGVVGTREIAGYCVELGADSFITNKPWALDLCRRLGLEHRLIPTEAAWRRALVLHKGKPVPVPEGFQLLTPTAIWPVLASSLFSPWGKLRIAAEYFLPRGKAGDDESLAHFVRRRFGREALERLVQPLVGGIYTSDPEKLSLRATMPRFLDFEKSYGSVIRGLRRQANRHQAAPTDDSGARYSLFATLAGGIGELIDVLAQRVRDRAMMHLQTAVESLLPDSEGARFGVVCPDRVARRFDAIVIALPAYRAADLIASFAGRAAQRLREIDYASTAIVVSGHKLTDVRHPLDAFGLVVPAVERRHILAVSFTSRKFSGRAPAGCVQLRTFVGGAMQPELMDLSDDEILGLVRRELSSLLGVAGQPDFELIARWNRAMPQYHLGHLDRVAQITSDLARFPGLALAGNAYAGVGLPDCIRSGELAAERVAVWLEHLSPSTNG